MPSLALATSNPAIERDEYSGATILTWDVGELGPGAGGALSVTARVPLSALSGDAEVVLEGTNLSPEASGTDNAALVPTHVDARLFLPLVVR